MSVKASITSLDRSIDTGDLKFYFETACQFIGDGNIEVTDPMLLGGGKAEIVLKGLTVEGIMLTNDVPCVLFS